MALHPGRLLPIDLNTRGIERRLYQSVADLPLILPHGHTAPAWYATDAAFPDPAFRKAGPSIAASSSDWWLSTSWTRPPLPRGRGRGGRSEDPFGARPKRCQSRQCRSRELSSS